MKQNFLKTKKGQMIVFGGVVGVLFILITIVLISSIQDFTSDPTDTEQVNNVSFDMELKDGINEHKEEENLKLDEYANKITRPEEKIVSNKEINFSIGSNSESEMASTQKSASSSSDTKTSELENIYKSFNPQTPQQSSYSRYSNDNSATQPANPSVKNRRQSEEETYISQEINNIYRSGKGNSEVAAANYQPTQHNNQQQQSDRLQDKRNRMLGNSTGNSAIGTLAIPCVIHGTQKVKENNTVILRTTEVITINNQNFPRNTIIYGTLRKGQNDRISIIIDSPFEGRVYYNGTEGIKINDSSISNEASKEAQNQATQQISSVARGSQITQAVVGVASVITSSTSREKQIEVTLVDNLKLTIK